jgi:5-methylcytosine-specific restriction endonuclease McrA
MPRNPRRYDLEYAAYDGKPEVKKKRAMRNKARRQLESEGVVSKGDGKDVDHKRPIRSGGSNTRSNLRAVAKSSNRGWRDGVEVSALYSIAPRALRNMVLMDFL